MGNVAYFDWSLLAFPLTMEASHCTKPSGEHWANVNDTDANSTALVLGATWPTQDVVPSQTEDVGTLHGWSALEHGVVPTSLISCSCSHVLSHLYDCTTGELRVRFLCGAIPTWSYWTSCGGVATVEVAIVRVSAGAMDKWSYWAGESVSFHGEEEVTFTDMFMCSKTFVESVTLQAGMYIAIHMDTDLNGYTNNMKHLDSSRGHTGDTCGCCAMLSSTYPQYEVLSGEITCTRRGSEIDNVHHSCISCVDGIINAEVQAMSVLTEQTVVKNRCVFDYRDYGSPPHVK